MALINLIGNLEDLDQTLLICLQSGFFHPEVAIHTGGFFPRLSRAGRGKSVCAADDTGKAARFGFGYSPA